MIDSIKLGDIKGIIYNTTNFNIEQTVSIQNCRVYSSWADTQLKKATNSRIDETHQQNTYKKP